MARINRLFMIVGLAFIILASAYAHDLFLKLDDYFLRPNSAVTVRVLNGSFQSSDGAVPRERLAHLSLRVPSLPDSAADALSWRIEDKTSVIEFKTGKAGTYVAAISTKPREIELKAADFNDYLDHDGLPDTLEQRRRNNELGKDVRERYSKHVRAIFQVGDRLSDEYKHSLGYPVEIIPRQNPYSLKAGDTLHVLCTHRGKPISNQYVMAGWETSGGKTETLSARTDASGIAQIELRAAGKWYVKFIHMTPLTDPKLNYESEWASLTFAVK